MKLPLIFTGALLLSGCSVAQNAAVTKAMATPAGALFCAIQTTAGPLIVTAVDAQASALAPASAPVAIIVAGMAKAQVDADCAAAGPGGVAVSPPAAAVAVPQVAVVVKPASP